ncbi:MAG: right-handed parallel beta-helix repeat-containing protein [Thermoleophilaceae bacterium]|nr:right-handed parallel beta-helix repeat-containing protein [Thermoleophilaceae bacterium]
MTVRDSGFYGNLLSRGGNVAGGAFRIASGAGTTMDVQRSEFVGNEMGDSGGGVISWAPGIGSSLTVDRSSFVDNIAGDNTFGVAIGADSGNAASSVAISNSHFEGNEGGQGTHGGALRLQLPTGTHSLVNNTITGNRITVDAGGADGAGIFSNTGTVTARNNVLHDNTTGARLDDCYDDLVDQGGNKQAQDEAGVTPGLGCGLPAASRGIQPQLGALGLNGGNARNRVPEPGSPLIDAGVGPCPAFDIRGVTRPQLGGCDAGAAEALPQPPAGDTPTPTTGAGAAAAVAGPAQQPPQLLPVLAKDVVILPAGGTPLIRLPGTKKFVPLAGITRIPVGSIVDARKGRVTIVSAKPGGGFQAFTYFDGLFRVDQGRDGVLQATLVERLSCTSKKSRSSARKPKKRKLWGDGKGSARTNGRYGAAVVRGTKWLVEDTCKTTRVKVAEGTVTAIDAKTKKQRQVKAPRSVKFPAS